MESRKEQKERRRQEIIFAALELFVSKGYAATKIADIAQSADMSTGLLFHYFESKEKLYEELVRMGLGATRYPVEQKCVQAIDFFTKFTSELFKYIRQQPVMAKMFLLMSEAQRNEATPPHIREGNPVVISNAFWCALQGIVERYAICQDIDIPEADWVVDIIRKK